MTDITKHAKKRIRQRISGANTDKLMDEVKRDGHPRKSFSGAFGRYLDKEGMIHGSVMIVHKGKVYCFNKDKGHLITVMNIPSKFKNYKPK